MDWPESREQTPFVNRAASFPHDRGYRSQNNPPIIERRTESSMIDEKRFYRQGTGESDGRRSNRRLRYTIPLRHGRPIPEDEETGFGLKNGYATGHSTRLRNRHELVEIVSTKWVPDGDGREVVTLITRNPATVGDKTHSECESRWAHIKSEATTFKEFQNHMMDMPGLEDDDRALALQLLMKVQKTYEKQYVHGRFLKPRTLVYDGANSNLDQDFKVTKTVTFVGLPVFTTECAQKHTSTKDDDLHPVRALLQSRYHLESTKKRDQEQVIAKSKLHGNNDHVVHVPQIWALIINKHTVITCAPFDTAFLRGNTIDIKSYAAARLDEATWSVQFTDSQGSVFYLPLRLVKSFFSLVEHIAKYIIHDPSDFVEDQLLKNGPLLKLVTKDDTRVTAETWLGMVEKKKTEVIQLRIIQKKQVCYYDFDGNGTEDLSDSSSETSDLYEHQDKAHRHSSSRSRPMLRSSSSPELRLRSRSRSKSDPPASESHQQYRQPALDSSTGRMDRSFSRSRRVRHRDGSRYPDDESRRRSPRRSRARPRHIGYDLYGTFEFSRPRNTWLPEIYYQPSDKQLARSRKDMLRSQVLSEGLPIQSEGQTATKPSIKYISPQMLEGHTTAGQSDVAANEPPTDPSWPADSLQRFPDHQSAKGQNKKVNFEKLTEEVKPGLKTTTNFSKKEPASLTNVQSQVEGETRGSPTKDSNKNLPIFLWSTEHSVNNGSASVEKQAKTSKTPTAEDSRTFSTSKSAELVLHTVTTEAHANLRKSKYAVLYEETTSKGLGDLLTMRDELKRSTTRPCDSADTLRDRDNLTSLKQGIINSAINVMYAFVPQCYESAVVNKYWGALYQLLTKQNKEFLHDSSSHLAEIWSLLQNIQEGVRADDGGKQAEYQIPQALPPAFQHIVLSLVVIGNHDESRKYSRRQEELLNECYDLLVDGRKQLMLMIHTDDYRGSAGFQAVDSEALLSSILANLVDHLSTDREFHLTEVYSEYTTNIQSVVRDQASVKVYDDIKLLMEEIAVIQFTLKQQQDVLLDFRRTIGITTGTVSLSILVINRMLDSVGQRIDDFEELQGQADAARFSAQQSISLKAESNNKAIIVFTVVTIIFLPLSFVTSYLGMNTSDLRNMKSEQTLFWAIGIPVAFVTFTVALMAAFYGTFTQRLTGKVWRAKEKGD